MVVAEIRHSCLYSPSRLNLCSLVPLRITDVTGTSITQLRAQMGERKSNFGKHNVQLIYMEEKVAAVEL